MKMNGFVVGGLLGAAAAMYFSRSNKSFSFSGLSSAGQALDSMVEKARTKMMDPDKRSYYGGQSGSSNTTSASSSMSGTSSMTGTTPMSGSSSTSTATGLDRVESIVKEDPVLKSQVNDILSQNRDTSTIR